MTKEKDIKTVVPTLRFPEFRDAGEWDVEKLSAIGDCAGGLSGKSSADFGSGEPYVTYKQIFNNSVLDVNKCELVAVGRNEKQTKLQYGDVLVTMSSETPEEIGCSSVVIENISKPIYLNSFCFLFRPNKLKYPLPKFSRYLFHSPVYRASISALAQGITRYNISKGKFLDLSLPIPTSENEQEKIADCLGSLDDLISAVADKIEALKGHKKGLMQQLFPANGKTTPVLRFLEFQNAGEWNKKILSDVCKLVRGPFGGALKKEIFVEDGYAVYEQSHAIHGDMNAFRYYITEDKFNELIRFAICPNDIIMSCSGTLGKFAVIPNGYKKGVINQALLKLSTKKDNDYRFIKLLLELPGNQEQLLSESAGGAIKNVASVGQIKEMSLCIPKPKEQQKIADCFASIDDLITAQSNRLEQLKAHKKGLMQQLFPNIE